MLKQALFIFCFLAGHVTPELKKMRDYFVLISKDEQSALALKALAQNNRSVQVTLSAAYEAAAEMALARYKTNPASKLKAFNAGRYRLEAVVAKDTASLEIRYIRLSIQQHVPSFLGYKANITGDRNYLIHHLHLTRQKDPELYSSVYAYLITRGELTDNEKAILRALH